MTEEIAPQTPAQLLYDACKAGDAEAVRAAPADVAVAAKSDAGKPALAQCEEMESVVGGLGGSTRILVDAPPRRAFARAPWSALRALSGRGSLSAPLRRRWPQYGT